MNFQEYLVQWSRLHGGAAPTGLIKIWLRCAFAMTTPLVRLNPNLITLSSVLVIAGAIGWVAAPNPAAWRYLLAGLLVLLVGLIDSFDGIVALRSSRVTSWGAYLDSIVDRFIDVGIGVLFFSLGAPLELVMTAVAIALIHEYMRARAGGVGHHEVGVVTVAEKPTRVALGVMFLVACAFRPQDSQLLATIAILVWIGLGIIGLAHLMRTFRSIIK
ncbi:MAG: CDP-alcohol phosphatidyltransferase family protein [Candidatus Nanopelagicales bacterium]|jgi:phosphatidylglycerophosphate synthase|nr:CDP-alcohol phosphatidyltransferase family protein [Candidatus Nanopelagicales bacterium]